MSIFTPVNQKRLTNVAVVRMKKCGKRFEIACYQNKVLGWRSGNETDLDEVLQTETVFSNVSKGQLAATEDVKTAFGADKTALDVCKLILEKGELQVSERERQVNLDSKFHEIVQMVTEKTVNPETQRPYPVTTIEQSLRDAHFAIKANRNAKQLALEAIRLLKETIPIQRAQMKMRVMCPSKFMKPLLAEFTSLNSGSCKPSNRTNNTTALNSSSSKASNSKNKKGKQQTSKQHGETKNDVTSMEKSNEGDSQLEAATSSQSSGSNSSNSLVVENQESGND